MPLAEVVKMPQMGVFVEILILDGIGIALAQRQPPIAQAV
jgi:hypothetical protein